MKKIILVVKIVLMLVNITFKAHSFLVIGNEIVYQNQNLYCQKAYRDAVEAERYLMRATRTEDIDDLNSYLRKAKNYLSDAEFAMMNCDKFLVKVNIENSLRKVKRALNEDDINDKIQYTKEAHRDLNSALFFFKFN